MRVSGCSVYVKENKSGKDKFEEIGKSRVFFGYPQGQKGYKVFYLTNKKNCCVHRCQIVECNFSFYNNKQFEIPTARIEEEKKWAVH